MWFKVVRNEKIDNKKNKKCPMGIIPATHLEQDGLELPPLYSLFPFGFISKPIKDILGFIHKIGKMESDVILGYSFFEDDSIKDGEVKLFAMDEAENLRKNSIYLKNDGGIEIKNETGGSFLITKDGDVNINGIKNVNIRGENIVFDATKKLEVNADAVNISAKEIKLTGSNNSETIII